VRGPVFVTLIATVLTLGGVRGSPAQEVSSGNRGLDSSSPSQRAPAPLSPGFDARSRIGVWGARSVASGSVLGAIPDSRLAVVGLRYSRVLLPTPQQNPRAYTGPLLSYTADLVPLARLHIPEAARPDRLFSAVAVGNGSFSTSGVGAYPVGLRVTFRVRTRLRPYVAGHTGALYFGDAVPDTRGRRLNFAAGIGAGLQALSSRGFSLTVGYRYHHLSNGFRGSINPGLDAHLFYLGVGTGL